jgi:hypothetical protein
VKARIIDPILTVVATSRTRNPIVPGIFRGSLLVRRAWVHIIIGMLALSIAVAMPSDAFADDDVIMQYADAGSGARALFPADDLLDWGQLGPQCPNVGQLCIPNGSVATSSRGVSITIFSRSGGFNRADEGTIAWSGHFETGDHLIYAGNNLGTPCKSLSPGSYREPGQ